LVALAVAGGILAVAAPAAAHVTVDPTEATQGGFARLTFRVPTESDTLSTTRVEVHLPEDAAIRSVRTMPLPGWDAELTRRTLDEPIERDNGEVITEVVSVLTWTAQDEDAALAPGEFGEFAVSMGPLPEVEQLVFKALQTYSDDSVVRWIEEPGDGAELEHPAPVLTLAPAAGGDGDGHGDGGAEPTAEPDNGAAGGDAQASGDDDSRPGLPVWLAVVSIVGGLAGLAGLALGGTAFARTRR
jgi:uncharacterized protein YcnI